MVPERLFVCCEQVVGVHNINSCYDHVLKQERLQRIQALAEANDSQTACTFHPLDMANSAVMAVLLVTI